MSKILKSLFLVVSFVWISGFATFSDRQDRAIETQWNDLETLAKCKPLFVEAFSHIYQYIPLEILGIQDLNIFLETAFDDDFQEMGVNENFEVITATHKGLPVAFLTIDKTNYPNEIYLSQQATQFDYQRNGIGFELVNLAKEHYPETQKFVVITRIINSGSMAFFQKSGFTYSPYMHPRYNPNKYIGFKIED
ncbi:MAG: hypothetical protein K940chlam8_01170 [Chlamydiae bacterium]|nr:hypothetical protein [Chlamydiota bacterium]